MIEANTVIIHEHRGLIYECQLTDAFLKPARSMILENKFIHQIVPCLHEHTQTNDGP